MHPKCAHGVVRYIDEISNVQSSGITTIQRLERALRHANVVHEARGDVPHPNIIDPCGEEVHRLRPVENDLKHLELWDQYDWTAV